MASINAIFGTIKEIKKNKNILDLSNNSVNKHQIKLRIFMKNFAIKNKINEEFFFDVNNEERVINIMLKELDELISDECPLCGNELILDTQNKFGNEDNRDWMI